MESLDPATTLALSLILAAVLLYWHLWRAVAFLKPTSVRLEVDTPGPTPVPGGLESVDSTLKSLGFSIIGTHLEHPWFTRALLNYDYVNVEKKTFATVYRQGTSAARFYFVSSAANGGSVLTANYRRPGANVPGVYLAGGLEGVGAARLFKAHLRRLEEMPAVDVDFTIEGRVKQAAQWFAGIGVTELRRQHAVGLMWAVGALGIAGSALYRYLSQ